MNKCDPFKKGVRRFGLLPALLLTLIVMGVAACAHRGETFETLRRDGTLEFMQPDGHACTAIEIEIADTFEAHIKGLQGRESIKAGEGMLFVFEVAADQEFWMRNTLISLDIIFVAESGRVINIAKRSEPLTDKRYISKGPAKYVIEVPSGFTDRYGITEGFLIRWQRRSK
jgi:uncharacterized membrane protein (UPF0127 family)